MKPRWVPGKPAHTIVNVWKRGDAIYVKFIEGSKIRLRYGALVSLANDDLSRFYRALESAKIISLERLMSVSEEELDNQKREGERMSGQELADMNLFYKVRPDTENKTEVEQLIDSLNGVPIVELAYPQPRYAPASTPGFPAEQSYLNPTPDGWNAWYLLIVLTVVVGAATAIILVFTRRGNARTRSSFPLRQHSTEDSFGS